MWETIDPTILAVLPKQPLNGASVNGTHSSGHEWSDSLRKLEQFRVEYTQDDWDGQGAPAISREVLDRAALLARSLHSQGVLAPSWVLPSVQRSVGFEWDLEHGVSITLEIVEPGIAELFLFTPGKPTEHYVLSGAVTA